MSLIYSPPQVRFLPVLFKQGKAEGNGRKVPSDVKIIVKEYNWAMLLSSPSRFVDYWRVYDHSKVWQN